MKFPKGKIHHYSSFQIIILGFLLVIFIGSGLLMLPAAKKGPGGASFLDALFTAVSAVCVTGLVVHDTAAYWSGFGQAVILLLIQIGGMGVVTVAVSIAMISGKKIGLMQRSTMQEAIAAPQVGGVVRLTGFILRTSLAIELLGAVLMVPVFGKEFGYGRGFWYALFHSVSAFCNAGFDLMGVREPLSSLTSFACHPVINLVVITLIVTGGIGFLTWDDIKKNRNHWRKYRMQTKVILCVSAVLIIFPAFYFFFCEFSVLPLEQRIWTSLFQAVTPRTAGFNTVDFNIISEAGRTIMIVLMLIGGSPGSTAGGMKTTTAAVLTASAVAVFRRQNTVNIFKRSITAESIQNAAAILLMYLTLFLAGGIAISCIETLPILDCLFETASAIGTVGLSLGITGQLGAVSRMILIVLMFFGRVGGLTLMFAAVPGSRRKSAKLPREKITVG